MKFLTKIKTIDKQKGVFYARKKENSKIHGIIVTSVIYGPQG